MNDLINNINGNIENIFNMDDLKLYMLIFIDDMALFPQKQDALQSRSNDLLLYCNTWKLKVNTTKIKVMIFE